jgi:glycosyltransferase involved in cell wall biosynthesis
VEKSIENNLTMKEKNHATAPDAIINPRLSIIIPIYNVEEYIERCVRSLFDQTLENIEYIFVDDASPDRSIEKLRQIMAQYESKNLVIKIITHNQNKGLPSARNSGLAVAVGGYVFHCDSDDWLEKDAMEKMYGVATENDADIVWCDFFCSYPSREIHVKQSNPASPVAYMKSLLSEKMHGGVWNKLVRRTLYIDNKICFAEGSNMWEDLRVSTQLFYYARKIVYIPQAYYHYVQYNTNSLSAGTLDKKLDEMLRNTEGIIDFLADKDVQLEKEINYLKLAAKKTLLFTIDTQNFARWKQIYPESNKQIWSYSALPLYHRFLAWCVSCNIWFVIDIWIFCKKIKIRNR